MSLVLEKPTPDSWSAQVRSTCGRYRAPVLFPTTNGDYPVSRLRRGWIANRRRTTLLCLHRSASVFAGACRRSSPLQYCTCDACIGSDHERRIQPSISSTKIEEAEHREDGRGAWYKVRNRQYKNDIGQSLAIILTTTVLVWCHRNGPAILVFRDEQLSLDRRSESYSENLSEDVRRRF